MDDNCAIITLCLRKEVTCLNKELLLLLLKLAAGCVVIMTFIVIACLITPKIARFIEKRHPELAEKDDPERVDGENTGNDPENYKVQGIFDKSHIDGWDPNYKIYNEDICSAYMKANLLKLRRIIQAQINIRAVVKDVLFLRYAFLKQKKTTISLLGMRGR